MHMAFCSLGGNGSGKVMEDVVDFLHGLHLQHEAGNLAPPHLHHTCCKHSQIGSTSLHNASTKTLMKFSIQEQWPRSCRYKHHAGCHCIGLLACDIYLKHDCLSIKCLANNRHACNMGFCSFLALLPVLSCA